MDSIIIKSLNIRKSVILVRVFIKLKDSTARRIGVIFVINVLISKKILERESKRLKVGSEISLSLYNVKPIMNERK